MASPTHPDRPSAARALLADTVGARLAASATRVRTDAAQVFHVPGFLDASECSGLIAQIDAGRRPSTLLSDTPTNDFRTSESCDLDRRRADVLAIDTRIADLLGIDPAHGETMQGQRYAPNQHFRAHHDYFQSTQPYWPRMRDEGGQRTWTAMVYLNDVEEGGATWFPQVGIRVPPRAGMLLAWNNMGADGAPNTATLHEGTSVTAGVKYVVTKWFRELPWTP